MYKTSNDRRFLRNKIIFQQAFIDLVIEKEDTHFSIAELTRKADLNRMTFYAHYDIVEDVFLEFVDDMEREIAGEIAKLDHFDIDQFFAVLNTLMYREIEFFRHVAKAGNRFDFKNAFKECIGRLLQYTAAESPGPDNAKTSSDNAKIDPGNAKAAGPADAQPAGFSLAQRIRSDLCAVCIAYAYLDWLAGEYGDATLEEVLALTKDLLKDHLPGVSYR
jgi:AcrR family transcriptional regulator